MEALLETLRRSWVRAEGSHLLFLSLSFPDPSKHTIPIMGITAGLVFLGVAFTGAVVAIAMRKQRGREWVISEGLCLTVSIRYTHICVLI